MLSPFRNRNVWNCSCWFLGSQPDDTEQLSRENEKLRRELSEMKLKYRHLEEDLSAIHNIRQEDFNDVSKKRAICKSLFCIVWDFFHSQHFLCELFSITIWWTNYWKQKKNDRSWKLKNLSGKLSSLTAARNREALEWSEEKQKIVGDGGLNQRLEKENKVCFTSVNLLLYLLFVVDDIFLNSTWELVNCWKWA